MEELFRYYSDDSGTGSYTEVEIKHKYKWFYSSHSATQNSYQGESEFCIPVSNKRVCYNFKIYIRGNKGEIRVDLCKTVKAGDIWENSLICLNDAGQIR